MPDLKSELMKVQSLNSLEFDDDVGTPPPAKSDEKLTYRQRMWEHVRDNPGISAKDLADALGLDYTLVSSSLHKMHIRGIIARYTKAGVYHYETGLGAYPDRTPPSKRRKPKAKHQPPPTNKPVSTPKASVSILDQLTVREARALYEELKTIFGV